MRVLVTGSDGYLGALIAPHLMQRGHEVVGVDTGFYRVGWLFNGVDVAPRTVSKDVRSLVADDLDGIDAVVHLAELSNDPLGELSPTITHEINHKGSMHLARLARDCGVERFVYSSSCSVYGVATDGDVTEGSPTNPQTAYAVCKTLVESGLDEMADDDFSPTILRNATVYGASPRMRFDLVLNNLAGLARTTGEIAMTSDGTPWRPLVHALDVAHAIACTLEAPRDLVHRETFNVGDTAQNYQVKEIAEIVAEAFPGCRLSFGTNGADNRSYRVSFDKINATLPGFRCDWDAVAGRVSFETCSTWSTSTPRPSGSAPTPGSSNSSICSDRGRSIPASTGRRSPTAAPPRGTMRFIETDLPGAMIIEPELMTDDRGGFARTFCRHEFEAHGLNPEVAQANVSFNHRAGTLRGMHYQLPPAAEAKLVRCTRGAIYDVAVDLRPDSPTYLRHVGVELSAENRRALVVPELFGHGYQALTDDAEVVYMVSEFYTPGQERGFRYDDPAVGITWPMPVTSLSTKDGDWAPLAIDVLAEDGR